jgi:hypothetical protein
MKSTVVVYTGNGVEVAKFNDVQRITLFDKNYVKIYYNENGKTHIVETNMSYIFYDGVKE